MRHHWRALLPGVAILLLGVGGARSDREDARRVAIVALDQANVRLGALVRALSAAAPPVDSDSLHRGLLAVHDALSPARTSLITLAPEQMASLLEKLERADAQVEDEASLASDRSEVIMSALLPIAASITDTRAAIVAGEP